ncbi:MAG: 4-hydroxythreonine-4-phosphate dehydrogenase PdxA [Ekhidna sp.]|nr:4-hydroxythreonine-4-phosphate dehydrogenase PdxA [Ekhidna sp.]
MGNPTAKKGKPIIGITLGDVNGIGPEVIIKSLLNSRILKHFTPVIYGSGKVLSFYRKNLAVGNFNYQQSDSIEKIAFGKTNVINVWEEKMEITPGEANEVGGKCALKSLQAAVKDLKDGKLNAITTGPLSKELVHSDEFKFHGHTEYLTREAGQKHSLMFLISERLRIGVATGHIPLREVNKKINEELLESKLSKMIQSLQKDFAINKPKIAVMGLNPHAGENGLLGDEEEKRIAPAIRKMKEGRHIITGPFSSDGFFGKGTFKQYDGILAMYHDQGLIPFKLMAFDEGVNYTAGLPFVRTSPDHGTAFEIAGKNEASEVSFRNALYLANDIVRNRNENRFEDSE